MDYMKQNKEAWEEAFDNRLEGWGDNNYVRLQNEELPFLNKDATEELRLIDFKNKEIAQFCCNNGRELLSIMKLGAKHGMGFDIAENIIAQAKETANKANINCDFEACNIMDIDSKYHNKFDFICVMLGALPWFQDLKPFFEKVYACLKKDGMLFINELHPVMNMLALPGEECFDENNIKKLDYSYFRKEPWIETEGMEYMSKQYKSKTFCSYSHTFEDIINGVAASGLKIKKLRESDCDIVFSGTHDNSGIPLSYILIAEK